MNVRIRLIGALAIASLLVACGSSSKSTAPSTSSEALSSGATSSKVASSGAVGSSAAATSSGAVGSSAVATSSGAVASSSSTHTGPVSGFAVSFTNGYYWLAGTLNVSTFPTSIVGKVEFNGSVPAANIATVDFGVTLLQYSQYTTAHAIGSLTAIPLGTGLVDTTLQAQFVPGADACNGNYTITITATVNSAAVSDSIVYNYVDGYKSGTNGCP